MVSSATAMGTPMKAPATPHRAVQKNTEKSTTKGEIDKALPAILGSR